MAYQSLYRKYRPQTFADVVGQGHVTRTIQNALASGRLAHGYLFTGTRGTAKTTVARLLAKALNCLSAEGAVAEPCNRCSACVEITAGSAIDVIEMDAASHRGVADIEEVRKAVGYGPMELRYKVFIIDEAHQLSSDAKDAFLKTLEEPPANVVFILATTEPQAIPITIRSRCQQFDFKRGSMSDITTRLRYVLDCEGVSYAPEALAHIARGAEGSYRDSLSLLEQVLAFSPTKITTADVNTVLGTLDSEMLRRVTEAFAKRDAPSAFALAGELLDAGKEARTLLRTLSLHFRDMLLVSVGGPAVAHELTPEEVAPLQSEARAFTPSQMMRAIEILNEAQGETRWNNQHRLLVELTFLKLMNLGENASATPFPTAPIVFEKERPLPRIAAPPRPASVPMMAQAKAEPVATAPVEPPVVANRHVEPPAPAAPAPAKEDSNDKQAALPPGFFAADDSDDEDEYTPDDPEDTLTPSLFEGEPTTIEAAAAPVVPASQPEDIQEPLPDSETLSLLSAASVPPAVVEATEAEEDPSSLALTIYDIERIWPIFLEKARSVSKMTETHMLQAQPTAVERGTVVIRFRARSPYDMMSQPKRQEFVRELLKRSLGVKRVLVRFTLDEVSASAPPKAGPPKKPRERDPMAELDTLDADALRRGDTPPDAFGGEVRNGSDYSFRATAEAPPPAPRVRDEFDGHERAPAAPAPTTAQPINNGHSRAAEAAADVKPSGNAGRREAEAASAGRDEAIRNNALVQEVLSTFGGEIVNE